MRKPTINLFEIPEVRREKMTRRQYLRIFQNLKESINAKGSADDSQAKQIKRNPHLNI